MQNFPPEGKTKKETVETVNTADLDEAIAAAAEGKKVVFTYNEDYDCYVIFEPNGKVMVVDHGEKEYEHKMGSEGSAMDKYITEMRSAIDKAKK